MHSLELAGIWLQLTAGYLNKKTQIFSVSGEAQIFTLYPEISQLAPF